MGTTRRALLSVSDKQGLIPFAEGLSKLSFELVSTGGTAKKLREAGMSVTDVSEITGFPEVMDGRVKTLHPAVHGGLLARSGIDDEVLKEHAIAQIDLLVVNLYPFQKTIATPQASEADAIENIDVGGPAMLRAAAKNHERVAVIVDGNDYAEVLAAYRDSKPSPALRRRLAMKAFAHTASYDAAISQYLQSRLAQDKAEPDPLVIVSPRTATLRYGENPHQHAALYRQAGPANGSVAGAQQLQGKPLSFNNLVDADAALQCVSGFVDPACVIVKHANPCGVAVGEDSKSSYESAFSCDPTSAFGGVIAFNRKLDEASAMTIIDKQFAEVVIAPEIDALALKTLARKPNIRVLECGAAGIRTQEWEVRSLAGGGLLLQEHDTLALDEAELKTVSEKTASDAEMRDLLFAWSVVKFVKSNAIVYTKGNLTLGIGAGQASRVMSAQIAALKAEEQGFSLAGAVMASDAFFPFRDGIDAAAERGISAVIQPGGSLRDDEIIQAANDHGITMIFTGTRHFRH